MYWVIPDINFSLIFGRSPNFLPYQMDIGKYEVKHKLYDPEVPEETNKCIFKY